ncbi:MAG: hypothetical protein KAI80_05400 [Hyphomicrobiaceae bacterium]|nr:hypothetical protein [Hyphomicrobiaceae bacterium]
MALLTAAEARLLIPQLTNDDANLTTMIDRAEGAIASWCRWPKPDGVGRPMLEQSTYTFYLNGPAFADFLRLDLPMRPVQSITSIHDDPDRDYGAGELVPASDYDLDADAGEVFLRPESSHGWSRARRAIRVVGVFGLNEADDVEDIKQAIAMLVKHWWDLRHTQGVASATQAGQSQTRREEPLPAAVRQLAGRLRLWGSEIA